MNDLLPVGSKIVLNNGRKLMIMGYLPSKPNDKFQYDYICCRGMYGIIWKKDKLVFDEHYFYVNNSDIDKVLFIGYSDDDFDLFDHSVEQLKSELKKARKSKSSLNTEEIEDIYVNSLSEFMKELGGGKDEK